MKGIDHTDQLEGPPQQGAGEEALVLEQDEIAEAPTRRAMAVKRNPILNITVIRRVEVEFYSKEMWIYSLAALSHQFTE